MSVPIWNIISKWGANIVSSIKIHIYQKKLSLH